jgi:hypothetical protein
VEYSGLQSSSAGWLLWLHFHPEDGGSTFIRNVIELLQDYTALHQCNEINQIWSFYNINPRYILNAEKALIILLQGRKDYVRTLGQRLLVTWIFCMWLTARDFTSYFFNLTLPSPSSTPASPSILSRGGKKLAREVEHGALWCCITIPSLERDEIKTFFRRMSLRQKRWFNVAVGRETCDSKGTGSSDNFAGAIEILGHFEHVLIQNFI